jgi:Fe-S-cluster containining protein
MKLDDIKRACKKCNASCCRLGGSEFSEREMKKALKINPEYKNLFIKVGDDHYEAKTKNGNCLFLDKNNSCIIHNAKPLLCKCWPIYVDIKKNKKEYFLVACPLTKYLTKKQIQSMEKQAQKVSIDHINCFNTTLTQRELKLLRKRLKKFKKKRINIK